MGERILVVDDEPGVRAALEGILHDEGFEVRTVGSGEDAVDAAADRAYEAALLDVWLPGIDGIETLHRLREQDEELAVVMISGHGTIETAVRATKLGAFDFVEKPLSLERTLLVLRNALRQRRLERQNRQLMSQLDRDTEILGRGTAADRLRATVAKAAASTANLVVRGERGSGRETLVRRIHALGSRAAGPIVGVPCGALDEDSLQTALLGDGSTPGRLQLARGGTLLLSEADRLPAALQRRLAARLGATGEDAPDARIAVTLLPTANLDGELADQVDVLRVDVPPLRQRKDDIPVLLARAMGDLAREYGRPEKSFHPDVLEELSRHGWPGNLAELYNLVERLFLTVDGETIRPGDLPQTGAAAEDDLYRPFRSLHEGVDVFTRFQIRRALTGAHGDVAAAAKSLGLQTDRLRAKMKKLEIGG